MENTCSQCDGKGIIYFKDGTSKTCMECLNAGRLTNFHHEFGKEVENNHICPKCHGTGIVKGEKGACHTCWDCLQSGKLDNHSKNLPDFKLRRN